MLHWKTILELGQDRHQGLIEQAQQDRLIRSVTPIQPRRTDRVLRSVGKLLVHTGEKLQTMSVVYGEAAD